jgi:methionine sulfoxide reductase catalytic subunit
MTLTLCMDDTALTSCSGEDITLTHQEFTLPADRRLRLWIRPSALLLLAALTLAPVVVAWAQYLIAGRPPLSGRYDPAALEGPHGFPLWLRSAHYANLLFLVLMVRSGMSILMDHPRLYWNVHCTPGSGWIRFIPLRAPTDRVWTSKEDSRYISPWLALPGGRHTCGPARHWHFLVALFWTANGLIFVTFLFASGQWHRILPNSWRIFPEA